MKIINRQYPPMLFPMTFTEFLVNIEPDIVGTGPENPIGYSEQIMGSFLSWNDMQAFCAWMTGQGVAVFNDRPVYYLLDVERYTSRLNGHTISLDQKAWDEFNALLDEPLDEKQSEKLKELFKRPRRVD